MVRLYSGTEYRRETNLTNSAAAAQFAVSWDIVDIYCRALMVCGDGEIGVRECVHIQVILCRI